MPSPYELARALGSGITTEPGAQSLAPYGIRHSGLAPKGMGYFGRVLGQGGISTELSAEGDINGQNVEFPLLVPTLAPNDFKSVMAGDVPDSAYSAARAHALARILKGQSPFAGPQDMRMPIPQ